jgi:hypothetical protein
MGRDQVFQLRRRQQLFEITRCAKLEGLNAVVHSQAAHEDYPNKSGSACLSKTGQPFMLNCSSQSMRATYRPGPVGICRGFSMDGGFRSVTKVDSAVARLLGLTKDSPFEIVLPKPNAFRRAQPLTMAVECADLHLRSAVRLSPKPQTSIPDACPRVWGARGRGSAAGLQNRSD